MTLKMALRYEANRFNNTFLRNDCKTNDVLFNYENYIFHWKTKHAKNGLILTDLWKNFDQKQTENDDKLKIYREPSKIRYSDSDTTNTTETIKTFPFDRGRYQTKMTRATKKAAAAERLKKAEEAKTREARLRTGVSNRTNNAEETTDMILEDEMNNATSYNSKRNGGSPRGETPTKVRRGTDGNNKDNDGYESGASDKTVSTDNRDHSGPNDGIRFNLLSSIDEDDDDMDFGNDGDTANNETERGRSGTNASSIERNETVFVTAKIPVQKSKDGRKELSNMLRAMFDAFKTSCSSFIVYDFGEEKRKHAITSKKQIKGDLQTIRKYFSRISPKEEGGDIWFDMHIGFDGEFSALKESVQWWFSGRNAMFYRKDLQVRESVRPLWFLYSHENIKKEEICDAIKGMAKSVHKKDINIALTYAIVKDGTAWKPNKNHTRALHLEVERRAQQATEDIVAKMYGYGVSEFPAGIKMRYVKTIDKNIPTHTKNKIIALKRKQEAFLRSIEHATSWDIETLDHKSSKAEKTLREFLMELKTEENDDEMFVSVSTEPRRGDGVVFTFAKVYEAEARNMVAQLPSFLCSKHGVGVFEYFSHDAVERAKAAPWNDEKKCAVTQHDVYMDQGIEDNDGRSWVIDLTEMSEENKGDNMFSEEAPPPNLPQTGPSALLNDDASIASFRTMSRQSVARNAVKVTPSKPAHPKRSDDSISDISDNRTIATMNSKISTMENQFQQVNDEVKGMAKGIDSLRDMFSAVLNDPTKLRGFQDRLSGSNSTVNPPASASGGDA